MDIDIYTIWKCFLSGLHYLPVTLMLTAVPYIVGLVVGTIFTVLYIYKVPVLGNFFQVLTFVLSGVPMLVWLLIFNLLFMLEFNNVTNFLHIDLTIDDVSTVWIAIVALSIDAINYMSQTIKGAFLSIDLGQYEAGYSVGLTGRQTLFRIVIPQVVPVSIPGLLNNLIAIFKETSIVISIGVMDMFNGALVPCQLSYRFLEGYIAAAIIYWAISILLEQITKRMEKRQVRFRRKVA